MHGNDICYRSYEKQRYVLVAYFCELVLCDFLLQVRSLTLDVKAWEPSVINLFQSLGNTFANSVWEELLQSRSAFQLDLIATG